MSEHSADFCEKTQANVLSALKSGDFSKVSACQATRDNIKKSLASYAVTKEGVDTECLNAIESAAECGDFSKVSACEVSRATLKKVVAAKTDFSSECKQNVLSAAECGDFSKVSACSATREEIQKAVEAFKDQSLQTALKE